jgi:hypothetical protein
MCQKILHFSCPEVLHKDKIQESLPENFSQEDSGAEYPDKKDFGSNKYNCQNNEPFP